MSRESFLLIVLLSTAVLPSCSPGKKLEISEQSAVHCCYLLGMRYTFTVTEPLYRNMSAWNIESPDPPPVSPQQAVNLARSRLDKIEIPNDYFWSFEQAALTPVSDFNPNGKWIWKVSFRFSKQGLSSGFSQRMDFLITKDGKLIEPDIEKYHP